MDSLWISKMREKKVSVAANFSRHPGPRRKTQGRHSGEEFRELLVKWLAESEHLVVDLDGTSGFGSSFLDEAFGGLIRDEGMTKSEVMRRITILSAMDESYKAEVMEAIALARPR
jgi:hypothetical protein